MNRRKTILLADDDKVQTMMLTTQLRARGYSVATAYDATYAFMVAMKSPPDAVVLDIQMPGGTGKAVLERLKGSSKTNSIPVIILSGHSDRRIIEECKVLGAYEYLTKPADVEKLDSVLRRALGIEVAAPTSPAAPATPGDAAAPSGTPPDTGAGTPSA